MEQVYNLELKASFMQFKL